MGDMDRLRKQVIGQVPRFLEPFEVVLTKPQRQVVREMVVGIVLSGAVLLSEISRALGTKREKLGRKIDQLSWQLSKGRWDPALLQEVHLRQVGRKIGRDTCVAVDLGEITKPYARVLEDLCRVRDASDHDLRNKNVRTKPGYWLFESVAIPEKGRQESLIWEPFSPRRRGFKSENVFIQEKLSQIRISLGTKGIYVLDRGFDRRNLLLPWTRDELRFICRQVGQRFVKAQGQTKSVREVAQAIPLRFMQRMNVNRREWALRFGATLIHLPECAKPLWLIAFQGPIQEEPVMLLANLTADTRSKILRIIRKYLWRWGVEDAGRFLKQGFRLEKFLIRRFNAIQKLVLLASLAFSFLSRFMAWPKVKLRKLLDQAVPIRDDTDFLYYQIHAAIQRLMPVWSP